MVGGVGSVVTASGGDAKTALVGFEGRFEVGFRRFWADIGASNKQSGAVRERTIGGCCGEEGVR